MRDNESSLQRLSTEREERERERWSLLRHARDEAERSLSLAAQLAAKDVHIQQLQDNLDDVSVDTLHLRPPPQSEGRAVTGKRRYKLNRKLIWPINNDARTVASALGTPHACC